MYLHKNIKKKLKFDNIKKTMFIFDTYTFMIKNSQNSLKVFFYNLPFFNIYIYLFNEIVIILIALRKYNPVLYIGYSVNFKKNDYYIT